MEREKLFAELAPLVKRLVHQYGDTPRLRRDLPAAIYEHFRTLLDAFDPQQGIPLRPYLVRHLTSFTFTYAQCYWQITSYWALLEGSRLNSGFAGDDVPFLIGPFGRAQQMAMRLPEAIERLPHQQRQVVTWRYYEEYGIEEIAKVLEIEPDTARSLLQLGLTNLQQQLGIPDDPLSNA